MHDKHVEHDEHDEENDADIEDGTERTGSAERWKAAHSRQARGPLSDNWGTSRETLGEVQEILAFCGLPTVFGVDLAASPGTAVSANWYGPEHMLPDRRDSLASHVVWTSPKRTVSWLNPPYSQINAFERRAAMFAETQPQSTLCMLAFARTDAQWFHRALGSLVNEKKGQPNVGTGSVFWFRRGRVKFIDPATGLAKHPAPAASVLVLYGHAGRVRNMDQVGRWVAYVPKPT